MKKGVKVQKRVIALARMGIGDEVAGLSDAVIIRAMELVRQYQKGGAVSGHRPKKSGRAKKK